MTRPAYPKLPTSTTSTLEEVLRDLVPQALEKPAALRAIRHFVFKKTAINHFRIFRVQKAIYYKHVLLCPEMKDILTTTLIGAQRYAREHHLANAEEMDQHLQAHQEKFAKLIEQLKEQ